MPTWLFILTTVAVAGLVGGITNHFAIKMLFHPRKAYTIAGRRVPFTPGLIPKRKPEIAQALGKVVSSYLVTADGLKELLAGAAFRQALQDRLVHRLRAVSEQTPGLTVGELIGKVVEQEQWTQGKERLAELIREGAQNAVAYMWLERGWAGRTVASCVPGWSEEAVQGWAERAEQAIVEAISKELQSPSGERMLRQMASGLLDQAGGFLGALAGMFMDEDKLVSRLTPAVLGQLQSTAVRAAIRRMISSQLLQAGEWTLAQAVERLVPEPQADPLVWLQLQADRLLQPEKWLAQAEQIDVSALLRRHEAAWQRGVAQAVGIALDLLGKHMERIIEAIGLPRLVQEQVERFPVERLEAVILQVSGKEFRAITWLGVALGAMIGLMQSIFLLAFS